LGSLTTQPAILHEAGGIIATRGLNNDAIEAAIATVRDELGVLTNLYTPAAYKGRIARALVREALQQLRRM
jgi:CO/xanthine dehydrogenase FAD-binding subunit